MKTKTTLPHFAFSLLTLLLFAGCSSQPSISDAQAVFEHSYDYDPKVEKIVEFTKTDGQESNAFGVKRYKMDYKATIECISAEGYCAITYSGRDCNFKIKKGERYTTSGFIHFEKSEKGWVKKVINQ